jgi:6-phosphogluconolactonase
MGKHQPVQTTIFRAPSIEEISKTAAQHIRAAARRCVDLHDSFTLVLAGGNTPRHLYKILSTPPTAVDIPWSHTHLFWGDERWVPHDHPDSNFGMAYNSLIAKIGIPTANLHPMPTDLGTPEAGAAAYEKTLKEFFENKPCQFDIILLGMGHDGHTASLFPHSPALDITDRMAAAVPAPKASPVVERITLTLPAINSAHEINFLISGQAKQKIMQSILDMPATAARLYPAARVRPRQRLFWFTAQK